MELITSFVAGKKFSLGKSNYEPGDPVDVSSLPDHKVKQFLRQRLIAPNLEKVTTDKVPR